LVEQMGLHHLGKDQVSVQEPPRLGALTGAPVLAEIGDDRVASPTPAPSSQGRRRACTPACGKSHQVMHHRSRTNAWPPPGRSGRSPP
jgi:hypothetical protein